MRADKLKNIETKGINEIKINPNNPRIIKDDKFHKLVESVKSFPEMLEIRPIVVNKDMIILGGNMRYKACKEAGLKEIPVIIADNLTEEQEREFLIKDNISGGEWDWDILANEWDKEELEEWGLDVEFETVEPEVEEDDFEVDEGIQTDIVLGDLFEIGPHRLLCGDSTNIDDVNKLMNGEKADMVFTDPPYGISVVGKNGNIGGSTKGVKVGNYSEVIGDDKEFDPSFIITLFNESKIILWGANYFCKSLPNKGKWFVWDKNRGEGTTFSDCELAWSNIDQISITKYKCTWDGMRREGESGKRVHPTQKPIKLISEMLTDYTDSTNIIIDLFGGSGSTMVACHQLNRKCYMSELDPKYVQTIVNRMIKLDSTLEIKRNGVPYKIIDNTIN